MGCNCGKKKDVPVVTPVPSPPPIPVPQTPEELHAQEMEAYRKQTQDYYEDLHKRLNK
jgi:hypothetical protein